MLMCLLITSPQPHISCFVRVIYRLFTQEMWKNKPPFRLCLNRAAADEIIWHATGQQQFCREHAIVRMMFLRAHAIGIPLVD